MVSKDAEQDVMKRDLAIAVAMADGMAGYPRSDVTWWDMGRRDMPLLTIGGYLMRRRRWAFSNISCISRSAKP